MHLTNVEAFNREINSLSNCKIGIVKTKKKFSWGCEQRAALDESLSGGDEFASVPTGFGKIFAKDSDASLLASRPGADPSHQ